MVNRTIRINWRFLVICVFALSAGALTIGSLWYWNKHWRAHRGIEKGLAAYEQKQWESAVTHLGNYLAAIQPKQDPAILLKYAEAQVNRRPLEKSHVEQALRAYHQILRVEENEQVRRRLIEFYLQADPVEAQRLAEVSLEKKYDAEIACYAALAMMQRGQHTAAKQRLEEVIEKQPDCLQAYFLLAQQAQQNLEGADRSPLEWLNAAVEANPNKPLAYLRRASYLLQSMRAESAASDIRKVESLPLESRQEKMQMVSVYLMADRLEDARQHLTELQTEQSNDLSLWLLWAQWAVRFGQTKELIQVAQDGMSSLQPDPYDFLPTAAELLIQARQWEQAETLIRQISERRGEAGIILRLEGLLAQAKGNWAQAVAIWQKLSMSSANPDHLVRLAEALMQVGDPVAAVQHLRTVLLRVPEHTQAHALLARWYLKEGRWPEAKDHVQQLLRKQPDNLEYRKMSLLIRLQQAQTSGSFAQEKERSQIREEMEAITREDPSFGAEQIGFWLEAGCLEEAQAALVQLQNQEGPTRRVRLLQSDLLKAQGKTDQARQVLESICRDFPDALEPLQKRILLAIQDKQLDLATEILESVPTDSLSSEQHKMLRIWHAEVLFLKGQVKEGAEWLSGLAEKYPSDIAIRRRLLEWTRKTETLSNLQKWIDQIQSIEGQQGRQWRYEQARLLFERGNIRRDYSRIVSLLDSVLRSFPEDLDSRILLAAAHEASGNLTLAVQEYQNALARNMENPDLLVPAVAAMYRAQEYRMAETVLQEAARRGIQDPRLSRLEVQKLIRQKKFGTATEILQEMLEKTPDDQSLKLSLALMYLYQNQLDEAENCIRQLQETESRSLSVIAARVELELRKKNSEAAIQVCDEAIKISQDPRLYALRAMTCAQIGQMQQAQEDVQTLLKLSNSSRESFLIAADLYLNINQISAAVETMEQAVHQFPEDPMVLRKAVLVYARDAQKRKTLKTLLAKALSLEPKDPHLLLLQAQMLLSENTAGSAEEGETILTELLREYPQIETGWVTMADWYLRNRQPGRAMDYVLRGLGYFPESKSLLFLKGQIEGAGGKHLAIPTLQDLYRRFPNDDRIAVYYIESCLQAGRLQEAQSALLARIGSNPQEASLLYRPLYLSFLYRTGQKEKARSFFELEIQQKTGRFTALQQWSELLAQDQKWSELAQMLQRQAIQCPDCLDVVASICLQLGLNDEPKSRKVASDCLHTLLGRYPDHPELMLSLAKLYHYWQQYKSAEQLYRNLLTQNIPLNEAGRTAAMNNLAWILFHQNQQPLEALQWADKGLTIQPNNADLLDTRGEIFFQMGDYAKAREDFEKAMVNFPPFSQDRIKTGYRLVKTLGMLGRKEEAAKLSEEVQRWDRQNSVLTDDQNAELRTFSNL